MAALGAATASAAPAAAQPLGDAAGVAVCLVGRLRALTRTVDLLRENFLLALTPGVPPDVFVYSTAPSAAEVARLGPLMDPPAPLVRAAKFDDEAGVLESLARDHRKAFREALRLRGMWLGAGADRELLPGSGDRRKGFGLFLLHAHRECMLMVKEREARLGQKYGRVVLSRPDLRWLFPHPPLSFLRPDMVWIPDTTEDVDRRPFPTAAASASRSEAAFTTPTSWAPKRVTWLPRRLHEHEDGFRSRRVGWRCSGIGNRRHVRRYSVVVSGRVPRSAAEHVFGGWELLTSGMAYLMLMGTYGRGALLRGNDTNAERWLAARLVVARLRVGRFPMTSYISCDPGTWVGMVDARSKKPHPQGFECREDRDGRYPQEYNAVRDIAACMAFAGGPKANGSAAPAHWTRRAVRRCYCMWSSPLQENEVFPDRLELCS